MLQLRVYSLCFLIAAALSCAGCKSGPQLAPVKGTVTLDSKPLAKGVIRFESAGHRPATGQIVNGEIVDVTTYEPRDGAPVGPCKVAIWASEEGASAVVANPGDAKAGGANYMSGKSLIPAIYNDPATSGLSADIKSGDNALAFQLFTAPGKSGK